MRFRLQGHQAATARGLPAAGADQRAALARPFRSVEGGRHAALPPWPPARRRGEPCRAMRGVAQVCARILRTLLPILPVRPVGGEIGRGRARRHHARDARTGMSLRLAGSLLLMGAGKMGGALLEGWLRQGLDPKHVFVRDPGPPADVAALIARHSIDSASLPKSAAVIVVAVKPQLVDETLKELTRLIGKGTVVLSIAAGR